MCACWNCFLVMCTRNCCCDKPTCVWVTYFIRWLGCMSLGWVGGLSHNGKYIQYAKNKMQNPWLFVVAAVLYFFCLLIHWNYGEGFAGLFQEQNTVSDLDVCSHWREWVGSISLFETLNVWDCRVVFLRHAKQRVWMRSVISSIISFLISESLDSDIQNNVLVVEQNTCGCDGVARCPV